MGYVNASLRETKWSGVKVDGGRFSVKGRIVKMGGGGGGGDISWELGETTPYLLCMVIGNF